MPSTLYFRSENVSFAAARLPDPATERSIRARLVERTDEAFRGLLLAALLTTPLIVAPVGFALVACVHRALGRRLAREGQLVPAVVLDPSGKPTALANAAEAHALGIALPRVEGTLSMERVALGFRGVNALILALARWIPLCIAHYQFEVGARTIRIGQYCFRDECFLRDAQGFSWVLCNPRWPRLLRWIACERSEA